MHSSSFAKGRRSSFAGDGASAGGCIRLLGLLWPSPTDWMVSRSNLFSPGSGARESVVSTELAPAESCEGRTCPPPLSLACGRPSSPSICAGLSLHLCLCPHLPVLTRTPVTLEDKEMATHSSVLAWRIPGTGEPGGLPSMGSHRVGHDWRDTASAVILDQASSWEPHLNLKKYIFNFNWRIIALQYCVGFCQTTVWISHRFSSVQFSSSVVSDSLQPHESQRARPPCPSPTPRDYSNSYPLSRWCHPAISSSVVPFSSCPQSLPASGSFPMSQLFASGGQSIGVAASATVLPMNTQDWSALGWTGWISLQSKGLSRVFSNTIVQKHQFFSAQLSWQSNSHIQHDHWRNHSLG